MRKPIIVAAAIIAASFILSPTGARAQAPPGPPVQLQPTPHIWFPWAGIGCAGSIIFSAMVANWKDNRQLTYWEAWTCGLLYWIPMPPQPKPRHHHHHAALTVDRPRYA